MFAVNYEFAAVPAEMLDQIDHPTADRVFRVLYECIRRGWVDPPIRYLMSRVKRCYRQVLRALEILEGRGRIRIVRRKKLGAIRNNTNLYEVVGLDRSDKNVTEVLKEKSIKAKVSSPTASTQQHRKLAQENGSLQTHNTWLQNKVAGLVKQVQYYQRGVQISTAKGWKNTVDQLAAINRTVTRHTSPEFFDLYAEIARLSDEHNSAFTEGNKRKAAEIQSKIDALLGA